MLGWGSKTDGHLLRLHLQALEGGRVGDDLGDVRSRLCGGKDVGDEDRIAVRQHLHVDLWVREMKG